MQIWGGEMFIPTAETSRKISFVHVKFMQVRNFENLKSENFK